MTREWNGYWINDGKTMCAPADWVGAAPYLRKTFVCDKAPEKATVFLCGLGWHELYVNGQKADDRVLAPVVTQYEKRDSYIEYDVTGLLKPGKNAVAVLLGNGWYNCHTTETWSFDKAPWRDWPKLLCDIVADGKLLAKTETSWRFHESPVRFDALRNGEHYDARFEIPGFADPDFDDSGWKSAVQCNPPGGLIVKEDLEPCKVMREYEPVGEKFIFSYQTVYDFGTNLTGWCEIEVEGVRGETVKLEYAEQLRANGNITQEEIGMFIKKDGFQTDTYTLKGEGVERFRPRFTYHGFRYVLVSIWNKDTKLRSIKAQFVHNSFRKVGEFESSDATLNRLQQITMQSYLSNFTGIPTDCPHREKNGWTGDANIACETGLWNRDGHGAYTHFMRLLADTQRVSGQLPGIAPSGGWGFNWGSGPAWDSLLFEGCWQVYRFYGDDSLARELYGNMKRYVEYCRGMSENNIVRFGLGDWCHWNDSGIVPVEVTSTGYYYSDTVRLAKFAALFGKEEDAKRYTELAAAIRKSFNEKFYNGDGTYSTGVMTALAAPLFFGLAEKDQELTAKKLAELVRANSHKADFGILGAKYVPRVLSDYGYAEDAFQLITQPEFPGWGYWVKCGATTLWEHWNGCSSQNHIMYGDISAWMYQYLGGAEPSFETPGFKHFTLKPNFVPQLSHVKMSHDTPYGELRVEWRRDGKSVVCEIQIPDGCSADLVLPGKPAEKIGGRCTRTFEL